ncbi:hypothetical protein N0V86_005053 [Didymella sp. IMI 355093]|nr:hypothetical protein N0V86_005053 [Didymella sp. IMI 355093]
MLILQSYDWDAIAKACNSTKGACSKRYSRLKLAFERGDAVPSTPGKANKSATVTPKKTPLKAKVNTEDGESTATSTPKRKRTAAKKVDYAESEDDEEDQDEQPKRAKSNPRPKPRPKNGFRASDEKMPSAESQSVVKGEPNESDGDVFTDAPEQALADVDAEGEIDEVCKCNPPPLHLAPFSLDEDGADTPSAHLNLLRKVHTCERDG